MSEHLLNFILTVVHMDQKKQLMARYQKIMGTFFTPMKKTIHGWSYQSQKTIIVVLKLLQDLIAVRKDSVILRSEQGIALYQVGLQED